MTRSRVLLVVALGLASSAPAARAHGFHAEAWLQDGEVVLEVYFSDGSVPGACEVEVRRDETVVQRGRTDPSGFFRFRPAVAGQYVLEVVEPGLHEARAEVEVPPLDEAGSSSTPDATASVRGPGAATTGTLSSRTPPSPGPGPEANPGRETRSHRGGVPWVRVVAGVAIVLALAGGLALLQRMRNRKDAP